MPPGKVTTYQDFAAQQRKKREEEEALGRKERQEIEQLRTWRQPVQQQQTTINLPIVSAPQLAPQRGYDPRFDDPNYGIDPKDRRQAATVQPRSNVQIAPLQSTVRSDTLASLEAWRPKVDTGPAAFTAQQVQSPTVASGIRPLGAVQGAATEEQSRAQRWNQPAWRVPAATVTAPLTASRMVRPVVEAGVRGVQSAWNAWNAPEEQPTPSSNARAEAVRRTPLTPSQMETTRLMANPLVESGLAANQTAQARDAQAHRDYMRDGLASQPEITRRETWLDTQPAFQQYQQRARENRERAVTGEISPLVALLRGLGNTIFVMPTELVTSQRVAGVNADTAAAVNRMAGEELAKPGDRLTLAQVTAPLGSMLNKLNPFLPLFRQDPSIKTVYENAFWKSPTNPNGYESIWDVYNQEIIAAFRVEQAINALPAEQQEMARQTVILGESGGARQLAAVQDLQKKWNAPAQIQRADQIARIAEMRYQMDVARAQASGLQQPRLMEEAEKRRLAALTMAGGLYSDAKRWESMGTSEIIDSHANGWAQLVEGVVADPINLLDPFTDILVGGVLSGARYAVGKPLSFAKELIAPTKQAVQLLDEALPAARRIGQEVVEGAAPKLPGYNWVDRLAVVGKTPDAKAHMDRDVVWSFFARTLTNVQNAQDAQRLINTAIENPSQLVKGVKGLTGQQFQDISGFGGAVKFGGSSVANRELLDRLWLMQAASEDLHNLRSLRGDGYNMLEVMAEIDTILYRTAREAYGLKSLEQMPLGAVDYRQVAMADGRARLEWLNEAGKVIGSTVPMTSRQANEYQKSLRAALKGAQQSPLLRAVRSMDQVQRAVMSDLWLNLRPGHWVRNAMAATATLMTDDLYSLRPVQGILDDLVRKGVPDARVMEAMATDVNFGAAAEGMGMDAGEHWSRKVWQNNNAYAWANEQANRMWTGFTHILGNVPFGEQAFYVRAFDRSFSRAFTDLWKGVVNEEIAPRLQAAGLEPTTAARVSDAIISAGVYGNKADIASRVRSLVSGAYDPIDLRSLGVPDELVSAEGWKEIDGWLKYLNSQKQLRPEDIARAQNGVRRVFVRETERAAEILRQAPLQPGVYDRLSGDAALDGAALVDELTEAGMQGGMTRQQAQEQAVKFAKEHVDQSNQIQESLVNEIARVENPRAMTFAVDAWAKLHALRRQARAQVDELSQAAARYGGSKEARAALWAKKWEGTQRIYTEMIANMQEVVNDARLALAGGEEAAATFDWWLGIQRYLDYDDALIQEARQTALFATTRDPELWETVVDANRAYVDQAWLPMFHAVRRFPTVEALDVVADVVSRVEMFGATTSSYLRPFRDAALAKQLPWDEYWPIRNGAWRHWADMSRTYIEDAQRRITLLGLADSTESKLRWNDPFAGGDFLLAGPGKDGTWFAYRMDDWSVHRFSEAGGESALPEVPKQIIDDWERVIGTDDAQLDAAVEEIRQAAAKVEAPTPVTPKVEPTEIARTGETQAPGVIQPETTLSPNAEAPVSLDGDIDDVWLRIKRLTAERRAIREELDRVPVGGDGDLGGLTEGVRPLEPLPEAPLAEEIDFNALRRPYETPTVRQIERPATGFEDILPKQTQVDESIPNADVPAPAIPSGDEAVQRLNSRMAEIDAERARLLDIYSRLRYMQRNGETRLLRGSIDPDAPHAEMPYLPEPPGVEPLMPPEGVIASAPDPNARLTKPANWVSTQREPLRVGQRVTTPGGVGVVTGEQKTFYTVKLDSGKVSRYKRSNVQALTTPTADEVAQGQRIAAQAGMAQPARTRAPYETPTMRPVARPDDIPATPYGPQPAPRVVDRRSLKYSDGQEVKYVDHHAVRLGDEVTLREQGRTVTGRVSSADVTRRGEVTVTASSGETFVVPPRRLTFVDSFKLDKAVNTPLGEGIVTSVTRRNGLITSVDVEIDGVQKTFSPENVQPIGGVQEAQSGAIMDVGEDTANGRALTDAGRIGKDDTGALARVPTDDVQRMEAQRPVAEARRGSRADDSGSVSQADRAGDGQPRGMGDDARGVVSATERGERAGIPDTGDRGRPTDGGRTLADDARPKPKTTESNSGWRDYVISEADNLEDFGGPKARYRANVDAIKTLKRLEAEGRNATPEEQRILARYSGWGQSELSENVLNDEAQYAYRGGKKWEWEAEYDELKKLLSADEYKAAQASRKNAHFTSPTVVDAMWLGLDRMGLGSMKRLRVLEPSAGVGNFFGRMPTDLAARSTRHAVEIDSITGRIAQKLYPNSRVYVTGFENAPLSDNYYDLVISNVPFGNYPVFDRLYNNPRMKFLTKSIHNYFFAKALDKTRPGGVVAFITSSFTMNAPGAEMVRAHLATKAKLIGAIRLPETAFKRNAGTEVVTDVIFLRKLMPGETPGDVGWVKSVGRIIDGETFAVNKYFADHPEMIVGKEAAQGTMYARGGKAYTVLAPEKPFADALRETMDRLPQGILRETSDEQIEMAGEAAEVRARMRTKPGSYVVVGDKLKRATANGLEDVKMARAGDEMRLRRMMEIRDAARGVLDAQLKSTDDAKWAPAQQKLNELYDAYTAQYGKLNNSYNRGVYGDDPEAYFVQALEQTDGNKADIFTKRVVHGSGEVTEITNPVDALTMSLRERGRIDMDYIANVLKRENADANALAGELGDAVYRNPGGDWEVADEYLSGNVRRKLEAARDAAKVDPAYQRNVDALEKVQPKDKTASQIYTRLGVGWLDEDTYGLFIKHLLPDVNQRNLQVKYVPGLGHWTLPNNSAIGINNVNNTAKWGTLRKSALDLLDDRMNARGTVVYDKVDDKSVINPEATEAALQKIDDLEAEFRRWLWEQNPERAAKAERMFNDKMNVFVSRKWNGDHLTFAGMNAEKNLRAHQKAAVWRALQGNTLFAHEVGTGKTGAITATAMEMRRLGIAKKPMIVVPNHLYAQWPQDVKTWYPFARVLAPTEKDFDAANRARTMSRIATGDWDVVVVPQSQFVRLPLKPETVQEYIDDELRALRMALLDIDDKRTQKEVEKSIARLEAKLQSMADMTKDNTIFWDDLGVDALLVDEAHDYKNLFFSSRRTRVAGVGAGKDVNRALDMHMKVRMINKLTGNRNVVFATGTPVSNSVSEAYVMMRYLMEPQLEDAGIEHFDAWANMFGREVTELEMSPGGWQTKTRFNQYQNTQQLNQMMQQVMDIVRADEIQTIKIPKMKTGERILVESPVTPETESVRVALLERWSAIKSNQVAPTVDNHLKLNTDMARAGLDIRMYNRSLPDLPNSKINNLVRNVLDVWKRTADDRGTQLVFCEIGVPIKGQKFNVYQEIKDKLVAQGIPQDEIAFIHDAVNDDLRNALFADVNAGRVRVLIGNVQMEKGVNVQQNLYALHHLDGAWKPSTIEQRRGRMFRQGNLWAERGAGEVEEYVYIQPPMDASKWKLVRQKTAAINNFMRRDYSDDLMEELDEATDAMALIESRASGDPLMKEKVDTEKQLNRLRSLYGAHVDQRTRMQLDVESATMAIQNATSRKYTAEYLLREMEVNKASGIRVNGVQLSEKEELEAAIGERIELAIGELFGTPVEMVNVNGVSLNLQGKLDARFADKPITYIMTISSDRLGQTADVGTLKYMPTADYVLRDMRNVRSTLEQIRNQAADTIEQQTRRSAELKTLQSQPFERQAELSEAERRLKDIQARIRAQLGGQKTLSPWDAELKDAERTAYEPFKEVKRIDAGQEIEGWTDGAMIVFGDVPAGVPTGRDTQQIATAYVEMLRPEQWRRAEMAAPVGVLMDNKNPRVVLEVGSKGDDYIFLAPGRYAEVLRTAQGRPVEWRVGRTNYNEQVIAVVDNQVLALLMPVKWMGGQQMAKAKFGAQGAGSLGIVAPGTEQAQRVLDFFGTGAEKLWDVTKRTLHKGRHPTVSDVAAHQVRTMADAERKVLEYVGNLSKAEPNKLTAQQRLAIMDAVDAALPRFDDAVYASTKLAKKASDGAMLNFKDRRHFDSALSMIFPFHFFWTRSAKNWAKRVAKHPGVLNAYYEVERAIETENNQAGVPSRLRGTIPLWRRADGSQIRIGNPLHYALPFGMYFPQSQYFSEPDENQTEFDKWVQMIRQYTPGLLPGLQIAGDALMDQIQPLADGKRTDKYYVGSFIPQYAMANSAYKIATGKELPGARDPFDPYRAARAAAELGTGAAAPLSPEMASYAQQIAANVARNRPRYTNIPLNKQQEAEQAFLQSQQRAGAQRGLTQATGYMTGVPAYEWPAQEQAGRQMMDQYRQAGYNAETNPYGSKAAQTQVREQNPALALWWQKGSAVPGQEGEPGVSAQLDPLYDQRNALYDQRQQQSQMAVDRAIAENPNIGGAAMSDARSAVYDQYGQKIDPLTQQIDALRSQLPADADPQSGYNPQELQQKYANQVMAAAAQLPGRPDETKKPLPPGEGATDAQWAAYKKAIAGYSASWDSYRARQRQYVIDNLAAKEMGMQNYGRPFAGAMTPEQAVQAWEQYQVRNQGPLEQARRGEIEAQQPLWDDYYRLMDAKNYNAARQLLDANPWMKDKLRRDAASTGSATGSTGSATGGGDGVPWFDKMNMGAVRRQQISALYGDEGVAMYDAYIALPKASEERAAYRAANPEIKLVLLAGFNPDEYGQMVEMFGADALVAWANVPAYAETEEAKNARSEYFKANPQAWLVQSWLRGRPTPITESGEVDEVQNNFGADWKAAEAQFGPEIWQLAAAYRAADAETRRQMRAVTPISAFYDWWYANLPDNFSSGGPRATYISSDGLVTYDQYGRRLDSFGNVARNNYNPTRRKSYPPRWQTPEIRPRYMDPTLRVDIEDLRQWRPTNRANWWSVATDLKPDQPRPQRTSFK